MGAGIYICKYICAHIYIRAHIVGSSLWLQTSTSAFFMGKTLQVWHPERATNLRAVNRIRKIAAQISLWFTGRAICRGTGQKEMQMPVHTNWKASSSVQSIATEQFKQQLMGNCWSGKHLYSLDKMLQTGADVLVTKKWDCLQTELQLHHL